MILRLLAISLYVITCSFKKIDYNHQVHTITSNFEKYVKENYNFDMISGSTGSNHEDIYVCNFAFAKFTFVSKNEAMVILYDLEESFLNYINSDIPLKPYLHNYPYTYNDIEFTFMYFTNLENMPPQTFESISHKKNVVEISVYNKETQIRKTLYRAKYKEFLEDVNQIKKLNDI
jgi:hypothetical protein